MTPEQAFLDARAALFRHRTDLDAARAAFRWPTLDAWNWVDHYFEPFARGNTREALRIIRETDTAPTLERATFDELADRSRRVARYLTGLLQAQFAIDVSREVTPNMLRKHRYKPLSLSARILCPRLNRDATVPMEQCSAFAIS